jgi:hypothetical protein
MSFLGSFLNHFQLFSFTQMHFSILFINTGGKGFKANFKNSFCRFKIIQTRLYCREQKILFVVNVISKFG